MLRVVPPAFFAACVRRGLACLRPAVFILARDGVAAFAFPVLVFAPAPPLTCFAFEM